VRIAVLYDPSDNLLLHGERRRKERSATPVRRRKRERRSKLDREHVLDAIRANGHEPYFHELGGEEALFALAKNGAELVFNMTEAYEGDDLKEAHVAAFLDLLDLRYTGAGPYSLFLAQDKSLAKKLFNFHGIRTPNFATVTRGKVDHMDDLEFPLIVKPAAEDGSVGIDAKAVVNTVRELMERVSWVQEQFDCAALIEEYIEGREIYVGVLGNEKPEALPPVELDLSRLPKDMPRIAGREVKWDKGTEAYDVTRSQIAEGLGDDLDTRLRNTALEVYEALKLRDYGRVDMRVTPKGEIFVIEANPNPWLAPEAELAIAAESTGRDYEKLIGEIVSMAAARYF
jgi:D-alanine-D-alanine ligase